MFSFYRLLVAGQWIICGSTYILQQLLQALLELVEVAGGDEALPAFLQAVSGQLYQLMVDEAQDPVGQRANLLRGRGGEQLSQARRGWGGRGRGGGEEGRRGEVVRGGRQGWVIEEEDTRRPKTAGAQMKSYIRINGLTQNN